MSCYGVKSDLDFAADRVKPEGATGGGQATYFRSLQITADLSAVELLRDSETKKSFF